MLPSIRKAGAAVALLGARLGAAAIAGAAGTKTGLTAKPQRGALGTTAAKVKAAVLEKVPGATVLRTEAGGPYSTAYHAHVKTADGTLKVVLVDKDFEATAVQADNGRRGRGDRDGAARAAAAPAGGADARAPGAVDATGRRRSAPAARSSGGGRGRDRHEQQRRLAPDQHGRDEQRRQAVAGHHVAAVAEHLDGRSASRSPARRARRAGRPRPRRPRPGPRRPRRRA